MRSASRIFGILRIVSAFCVPAVLLLGCDGKNDVATGLRQSAANRNAQAAIPNKAELQRLLVPAMGTNEIVASLGEPRWIENLGEGQQVWHHSLPAFPADDEMRGTYIAGVAITITNGHLASWGCVYVGDSSDRRVRKEEVLPTGNGQTDSPALKIFVVSSDPIADGRFIDTERFPKLGFISPSPSLRIRTVKEVTLEERTPSVSENSNRTTWSFGIFLTVEDGARLKSMTATNISKKILVVIGDEAVSAPTVMAPLETGSFAIEGRDRWLMESLRKQLARMEREPK